MSEILFFLKKRKLKFCAFYFEYINMMEKIKYKRPQVSIVDYELDDNIAQGQGVSLRDTSIGTVSNGLEEISFP